MDNKTLTARIIGFAQYLGRPETSARDVALRRGWIDHDGDPTLAGQELIRELSDQSDTRSVFRGNI